MKRIRNISLFCLLAAFAVTAHAAPRMLINGAGATFPYPLYSKWFYEYNKLHPEIQLNYQSIGSGGGIRQITAGTVDFGASDAPVDDAQLQQMNDKLLHIPTCLGAVVVAYNVPELKSGLRLTGEALADIFLGKIEYWDDEALKKLNPDAMLPHKNILVAHRSDGSGTTYVFTDYLAKVSG